MIDAAKLRRVAEKHALELAQGVGPLMPRRGSASERLLEQAWRVVRDEARAGTLTDEGGSLPLSILNVNRYGTPWEPWCAREWGWD